MNVNVSVPDELYQQAVEIARPPIILSFVVEVSVGIPAFHREQSPGGFP